MHLKDNEFYLLSKSCLPRVFDFQTLCPPALAYTIRAPGWEVGNHMARLEQNFVVGFRCLAPFRPWASATFATLGLNTRKGFCSCRQQVHHVAIVPLSESRFANVSELLDSCYHNLVFHYYAPLFSFILFVTLIFSTHQDVRPISWSLLVETLTLEADRQNLLLYRSHRISAAPNLEFPNRAVGVGKLQFTGFEATQMGEQQVFCAITGAGCSHKGKGSTEKFGHLAFTWACHMVAKIIRLETATTTPSTSRPVLACRT